jgi:hypothetical protein
MEAPEAVLVNEECIFPQEDGVMYFTLHLKTAPVEHHLDIRKRNNFDLHDYPSSAEIRRSGS